MKNRITSPALFSFLAFLLSGPVSVLLVSLLAPQPAWSEVAVYKSHFHFLQTLPYFFGFTLVITQIWLAWSHLQWNAHPDERIQLHLWLSFSLTLVFAAVVSFNYILQSTFLPHLVYSGDDRYDAFIAATTMTNPDSLGWSLEMWGYAFLGLANWFLATYYQHVRQTIYYLLKGNTIISMGSLAWAIVQPAWVETIPGLYLFLLWNVLMLVIMWRMFRFHNESTV